MFHIGSSRFDHANRTGSFTRGITLGQTSSRHLSFRPVPHKGTKDPVNNPTAIFDGQNGCCCKTDGKRRTEQIGGRRSMNGEDLSGFSIGPNILTRPSCERKPSSITTVRFPLHEKQTLAQNFYSVNPIANTKHGTF